MIEYFCSFYGTVTNGSKKFVEQCLCCSLGKMTEEEFERFLLQTADDAELYRLMFMGNFVFHSDTREKQDYALRSFEKDVTKHNDSVRSAMVKLQTVARWDCMPSALCWRHIDSRMFAARARRWSQYFDIS